MDFTNLLAELTPRERAMVKTEAPLCELTTLRIGGPAALVCTIETPAHARKFHTLAKQRGLEIFVLGGGSNVLAADTGFRGLILRVATTRFSHDCGIITAGCGLNFDGIIAQSLDLGFTGLEFASGIPGTLGGAIVGNAGCYGHEIGEFIVDALVLTPTGELVTITRDDFHFRYRASDLRETGHVVLEARLCLQHGDLTRARHERQEKLDDRRRKHPVDLPSAGSWFRNLPPAGPDQRRRAAGHFLEQAGAKKMSEGDARVFHKHANMIINAGHATSGDVLKLAERMRAAVQAAFGFQLVAEVRYLGDTANLNTPPA